MQLLNPQFRVSWTRSLVTIILKWTLEMQSTQLSSPIMVPFTIRYYHLGLERKSDFSKLFDKMFNKQIGSSIAAYVDDIVVRSSSPEQHLSNPAEVFEVLRCYYMCLNPEKCVFGVGSGKF